MLPAVRLLRPHQWTKNLLVAAPFLFTASWGSPDRIQATLFAFFAFCFATSAVYIINDLFDIERDRAHPRKKQRPLASGQVSVGLAKGLSAYFLMLGVSAAWLANQQTLAVLGAYLAVQVAYNLFLKREPVADVFALGAGFVLRAVAGAAAIQVQVSGWLFAFTAMVALFLGFAKRRGELLTVAEAGTREVLQKYSQQFLDHALTITATGTLVTYALYVIASETARQFPGLVATLPIVAFAIMRYLYLSFVRDEGSEPDTLIFRDGQLAASLVLYLVAAVVAML